MADRYASHLPVLRSLLAVLRPSRILEFGAGLHSTPLFVRSGAKVVSIEPDPEWRQRVALACESPNLALRPTSAVIPADFDLVFIDNGVSIPERISAIRFVLTQPHPVTAIHDAEVPEYATAIEELAIKHETLKTDPDTCVVWK